MRERERVDVIATQEKAASSKVERGGKVVFIVARVKSDGKVVTGKQSSRLVPIIVAALEDESRTLCLCTHSASVILF